MAVEQEVTITVTFKVMTRVPVGLSEREILALTDVQEAIGYEMNDAEQQQYTSEGRYFCTDCGAKIDEGLVDWAQLAQLRDECRQLGRMGAYRSALQEALICGCEPREDDDA